MDVLTRELCCTAAILPERCDRSATARAGSAASMRLLCPHSSTKLALSSSAGGGWRRISSVLPPPASALSAAQEVDEDIDDSLNEAAVATKTVHVRFVLRKKCLFGQQFLIVGDDPIFGLWDPSEGIPLNWSDGHIWAAELDLPAEKPIQFKFVLRGFSGQVIWQPGRNRVLQVGETAKTIVVSEDWDFAGKQKLTEEEPLAIMEEEAISIGSKTSSNGSAFHETHDALSAMFAEKISVGMNDEKLLMDNNEEPILVPGFSSVAASVLSEEVVVTDGADCNLPQISMEQESEVPSSLLVEETMISKARGDDVVDDMTCASFLTAEQSLHPAEDGPQSTVGVLKNDMLWGRKFLQQFLSNLGFSTNPTETT